MEFSIWVVRDGLGDVAWDKKPEFTLPEGADEEAKANLRAANEAFEKSLVEWKVWLKPLVYSRHMDMENLAQVQTDTGFVTKSERIPVATLCAYVQRWEVKRIGSDDICPIEFNSIADNLSATVIDAIRRHIDRTVYRNMTPDFFQPYVNSTTP